MYNHVQDKPLWTTAMLQNKNTRGVVGYNRCQVIGTYGTSTWIRFGKNYIL